VKRWLPPSAAISAALLVAIASGAHAASPSGELNLAWTSCAADGGVSNLAFACDVNSGAETLVLSFIAPTAPAIDSMVTAEAYVDLISQSSPLPSWWYFNAGTCRAGALSANVTAPGGLSACADAYGGRAALWFVSAYTAGGVSGNPIAGNLPNVNPGNVAQVACIDLAAAVAADSPQRLSGGQEYFVFNVRLSNLATVGGCAGCGDPVCLSFSHLHLGQAGSVGDWWITTPGPSQTGQNVTWQSSGANCNAVPVRNRSWGALKALYR